MNGPSELWNRLTTADSQGRLPAAMLLAGPRRTGKREFAARLAGWLVCEAASRPCGQCRGCIQFSAGVHPNAMLLTPQGLFGLAPGENLRLDSGLMLWEPKEAEKKRDVSVEGVRELLDRLNLTSHYGARKIAVISPADALSMSSENSLLKTFEEPPARTHLVLVSERWRDLAATLRSRCQILRFAPARGTPAVADGEGEAQWARALAELAQGRFAPLALVQGFKRDDAQRVLEAFLQVGSRWLKGLAVPSQARSSGVPPQVTAEAIEALIDQALEGLKTLDRVSAVLVLESIMIRWAGRTA